MKGIYSALLLLWSDSNEKKMGTTFAMPILGSFGYEDGCLLPVWSARGKLFRYRKIPPFYRTPFCG